MAKKRRGRRKSATQKKKIILLSVLGAVAVLLIGFGIAYASVKSYVNKVDKNTIHKNVYIAGIDVSGMTKEEAKTALEAKTAEYQAQKLILDVEGETVEITMAELGLTIQDGEQLVDEAVAYAKDGGVWSRYKKMKKLEKEKKELSVNYQIDSTLIEGVIEEKVRPLEDTAKDATITRKNGQFVITDEVQGKEVDLEASIQAIEDYFTGNWQEKDGKILLVSKLDEPEVTRAQLEEIQDVLGSFTTYCGVGGGRVQNIQSGTKHINGALIMPGEEYSANAAMEPYTTENGFTNAGSYENGQVVQSMGGGICQVSSTLYNAVILAELEVTERAAHSMTVGYVDPSMDAAIAGTWKDLKFKNNTDTPIYVEGYITGGNLTFKIYGKETRSADRTVKYESEVLSTTSPDKKYVATTGGTFGAITRTDAGHTGMKARLWKIVRENGKEVSREVINNSSYMASDATYSVSINTKNAEAKALVQNAIATQDEGKIKAAISQAKAIIKEAEKPSTPSTPSTPTTPETPEVPQAPEAPSVDGGDNNGE